MSKIKSITLSNIRRFGPETTIEFSPGATVLLAPNGTGKTAVFEAIEFGLTGKVARLGENLSPIIRDSKSFAQVHLSFEGSECSARVLRDGAVQRQGDLSNVFGGTDAADIPFLLRLTHLLDQRERDWFVQADAKVAGSHLAKLPIGRDGSQASTVLTGARRHLTEQLNQAQSLLSTAVAEHEEWTGLIRDRDFSTAQVEAPLRPRELIAEALTEIAEATRSSEQLPQSLLGSPARLDSLETVRTTLHEILQTKAQRLSNRRSELTALTGLLETFEAERERVSLLEQEYALARKGIESRKQEHARSQLAFSQLQANLRLAEQRRSELAQQLARLVDVATAKAELDRRTEEFGTASEALVKAEQEAAALREQRQRIDQINQQHERVRLQLQALSQTENELKVANQLVDRWGAVIQEIEVTNNAIEEARERLHTLGGEYQDAIAVHAQKAQAESEARSRLQTLTSAVDSMRQAVSMLAAHLPEDRADCPACGVVHGPEELHKRVHASLQAIDPTLVHAERDLKIAGDELRASDTAMTAARTALQSERSELAQREEQRAVLDLEIDEIRSNRHLTGDTPVLARDAVRHRLMLLDSSRQALAEEQASLAPPVAAEVSDQNSITLELALRALETVRLANAQASTHLDHATGIYAAQATESVSSKPMPELSAEQSENDQQIAALAAKAQSDNDALTRQQAELAELDSRIFDHERQLAEARSRLASIRGRWQQLALPGDPLADIARSHELRILSEISTLERHSTSLETLGLEISAWRKSEQNRVAQGLLDRRRGPQSEDEFSQQLQQRIERGRAAVSRLSNLSSALESLSRFLSAEISNIHDHVVAVVPRWQALLKRIVRDQRFSQTNLDFYSHYKKEHAAVLVPLHGDTVPVPSVASEAQMTDLQLTFLLSMAMNHRWSPWRALLLDDPTQHHDLVHAASVFDVLRDYIVDHDFQIVIATHDALQARFFMRKLQNDGIDARMWSLVPTVQGVTAIPGK